MRVATRAARRPRSWTDGRVVALVLVIVLTCVAVVRAVTGVGEPAAGVGTPAWALELVHGLTIDDRGAPEDQPYERDAFDGWQDLDGDCQNARHETLVAESLGVVQFATDESCAVAAGRWLDPYTGEELLSADEASIDHVVSLFDSHHAGAWAWDHTWKQALFNDIDDPATLTVSAVRVNNSKGAFGPDEWLPNGADARCLYVVARVRIKTRWQLSVTSDEAMALTRELETCNRLGMPIQPERTPLVVIDFDAVPSALPQAIIPDSCDARYPGVCIPTSNRDLDCRDIEPRRFQIADQDPHNFDGNHNGVGCELG